ncbi:MAG: hypothetical protein AAFZ02_13910, partial [Pseudomonadota bacterium]
ARLSVLISLFFAAATLFALSAGVIQSVGALALIAWIAAQFPGLDYRNQGTGRSIQRVFVPLFLGVMALLIAAAGLFDLRDAVRFEVVFAGDTRTVLVAIAVAVFGWAMMGQVLFHIWLLHGVVAPGPSLPLLLLGVPLLGLSGLSVFEAQLPGVAPWLTSAAGVSAFLLAVFACFQSDILRVVACIVGAVSGLALLAISLGGSGVAMALFLTQSLGLALLLWGAARVVRANGGDGDLAHMGGRKTALPVTYFTMLIGAAGVSGLGLPVAYAGAPLGLGGFEAMGVLLTLAANAGALWIVLITLFFTALAVWRAMLLCFQGDARKALPSESIVEERATRWVLSALALLVILAPARITPEAVAVPAPFLAAPALIFAASLIVAAALFVWRLDGTGKLTRGLGAPGETLSQGGQIDKLASTLVIAPGPWFGRTLGHTLDAALLDALMTRLARALLPPLAGWWHRLGSGRAAPYALTALVGVVLLSTIVAMVGA